MKTMFNLLILLGFFFTLAASQNSYDSEHLTQDTYQDPDEVPYRRSGRRNPSPRSYASESHEDIPHSDARQYQSLEPRYQNREPEIYAREHQYHAAPQHDPVPYARPPLYRGTPLPVQYQQPEDPSYHRPQEIVPHQRNYQDSRQHYHKAPQRYHEAPVPQHYQEPPLHYGGAPQRHQEAPQPYQEAPVAQPYQEAPVSQPYHEAPVPQQYEEPLPHYQRAPQHHQEAPPQQDSYQGSSHYPEPETKDESPNHQTEEPIVYTPASVRPHPRPLPVDPKLPLYFTMYEKRVIQDPLNKYGKGPWRYLTYGHGLTYGSKEPGKVFEKGYGYIRALGRDHCKLPEHLCPRNEEKPFEYEGRKEPYFGYRPH